MNLFINCLTCVHLQIYFIRGGSIGGPRGLEPRSDFKLPNFLKIEIIGFCLTTSLHKSNVHANHAHHTHHAQNWSVEPLSDFRLDLPLCVSQLVHFPVASVKQDIKLSTDTFFVSPAKALQRLRSPSGKRSSLLRSTDQYL